MDGAALLTSIHTYCRQERVCMDVLFLPEVDHSFHVIPADYLRHSGVGRKGDPPFCLQAIAALALPAFCSCSDSYSCFYSGQHKLGST